MAVAGIRVNEINLRVQQGNVSKDFEVNALAWWDSLRAVHHERKHGKGQPELFLDFAGTLPKLFCYFAGTFWRRRSESNEVFTDHQPQNPELRGYFTAVFTGVQEVIYTIRQQSDLTRRTPRFYSVIEEIVEGFVEGFFDQVNDRTQPHEQISVTRESGIECAIRPWLQRFC